MSKLTIVNGDDWTGLFIDGRLLVEGSSFSTLTVAEVCIKHAVSAVESQDADSEWLNDLGNFPDDLSDVVMVQR